ncbi:MAG TPA: SIS domain-containing protein [Spongiibacteraceae bacterium]|nr:SIS domain-containing protein [Spongiibacteraceae bacterium]
MDLTEHVVDNFHRHIDNTMQAIETLSPATVTASELLVQALLNEGKVYCCGEGSSGLLSQHFANLLLNRSHRERPGLPAIALSGDAALLTAITTDTSFNEIFAKQIRTLATPQDILVLISHDTGSGTALQTIQSAHDRNIRVVVLCNDNDGDIRALLAPDDCELRIAATQRTHFLEVALLTLHNLCELIELQLFGSEV